MHTLTRTHGGVIIPLLLLSVLVTESHRTKKRSLSFTMRGLSKHHTIPLIKTISKRLEWISAMSGSTQMQLKSFGAQFKSQRSDRWASVTNLRSEPESELCSLCNTAGNATAMSVAPCVSWHRCWNVNGPHTQTSEPSALSDLQGGITVTPAGSKTKDRKISACSQKPFSFVVQTFRKRHNLQVWKIKNMQKCCEPLFLFF